MSNLTAPGRLPYEVVDVFTDRPFAGNPLAVVLDADGLSGDQMQALAREFHLSETVFLLPARSRDAAYRLRIFTPEAELPFAGHPSIGAAVTAVRLGRAQPDTEGTVVQECGAGLLPLRIGGDGRGARLTGGRPAVGAPLDPAPPRAVVGLPGAAGGGDPVPAPRVAGCGLDFLYLAVAPAQVAAAALDTAAAARHGVPELCVFGWDPATRTAHSRVFCPGSGVPEDPATGSAALGLGAYLVATGLLPPTGESAYTVRQGLELHRPSTLHCTVEARDGAAATVTVAGAVVPIATGAIAVPPFVG
ncbi:hypothetical protein GCM10010124_23910 [Pilimelia terevasa]|uniref:Trans-2,3-dihydro-3-hydroxyanthranilate isomerase n=1 Tax=Pilimelia terevasa TaxID=53372 RepID=A0A8J3BMR9_9ACTN|nr:PhzF family phenazine biosynthesis protein [Pilimelia terevasa]GGK30362.1 hypothetical protein GCM10010124_23910 [Pilimelia terevasa]